MFVWGKARIIPFIAMAGIVALVLIGATRVGRQRAVALAGPEKPAYVRISVSDGTSVYLEFQGREVRAALSAEGLAAATPTDLGARQPAQEIALPIPADQLPAGVMAVKAGLTAVQLPLGRSHTMSIQVYGYLALCRVDEQKAEWQGLVRVGAAAADSAAKAPVIRLPGLEKPSPSVTAKYAKGALGIGVRLSASPTGLYDVRKDGKPVQAQVGVLDASGKQVASKTGPLTDFGFS